MNIVDAITESENGKITNRDWQLRMNTCTYITYNSKIGNWIDNYGNVYKLTEQVLRNKKWIPYFNPTYKEPEKWIEKIGYNIVWKSSDGSIWIGGRIYNTKEEAKLESKLFIEQNLFVIDTTFFGVVETKYLSDINTGE